MNVNVNIGTVNLSAETETQGHRGEVQEAD